MGDHRSERPGRNRDVVFPVLVLSQVFNLLEQVSKVAESVDGVDTVGQVGRGQLELDRILGHDDIFVRHDVETALHNSVQTLNADAVVLSGETLDQTVGHRLVVILHLLWWPTDEEIIVPALLISRGLVVVVVIVIALLQLFLLVGSAQDIGLLFDGGDAGVAAKRQLFVALSKVVNVDAPLQTNWW